MTVYEGLELTPRQAQIAELVATEGLTNKQIANRIHTSEQFVKNQMCRIFSKLKVNSRLKLTIEISKRKGITQDESPQCSPRLELVVGGSNPPRGERLL